MQFSRHIAGRALRARPESNAPSYGVVHRAAIYNFSFVLGLAFVFATGVPAASRASRSALSRSRLSENAFCAASCSVIASFDLAKCLARFALGFGDRLRWLRFARYLHRFFALQPASYSIIFVSGQRELRGALLDL